MVTLDRRRLCLPTTELALHQEEIQLEEARLGSMDVRTSSRHQDCQGQQGWIKGSTLKCRRTCLFWYCRAAALGAQRSPGFDAELHEDRRTFVVSCLSQRRLGSLARSLEIRMRRLLMLALLVLGLLGLCDWANIHIVFH